MWRRTGVIVLVSAALTACSSAPKLPEQQRNGYLSNVANHIQCEIKNAAEPKLKALKVADYWSADVALSLKIKNVGKIGPNISLADPWGLHPATVFGLEAGASYSDSAYRQQALSYNFRINQISKNACTKPVAKNEPFVTGDLGIAEMVNEGLDALKAAPPLAKTPSFSQTIEFIATYEASVTPSIKITRANTWSNTNKSLFSVSREETSNLVLTLAGPVKPPRAVRRAPQATADKAKSQGQVPRVIYRPLSSPDSSDAAQQGTINQILRSLERR